MQGLQFLEPEDEGDVDAIPLNFITNEGATAAPTAAPAPPSSNALTPAPNLEVEDTVAASPNREI